MTRPDLAPDALYHLATDAEWEEYRQAGAIRPPSLETEGFVHCSWGHQVPGTVARHFPGVAGVLALVVDPAAVGEAAVVEEDSFGSGQAFPHIYGPIPVSAIRGSHRVR